MLRSPFLRKLYLGYVALILLSTAIVGGLIAQQIEEDSVKEIRQSLNVRAVFLQNLVSPTFRGPPDPTLQQRIRALGAAIDTRLTVIGLDGGVIADSEENPSEMDNHANRPEILAARSHELGNTTRFSDTLGTMMMYLALPVWSEDRLVGYVRTSLPLSVVEERLAHLHALVALGAGIAVSVALILGLFFARRVTNPLTSMTTAAESMAHGNYDQRIPVTTTDEIGTLARTLNRLSENLRDRMETINKDRNKLLAILGGMVEGVVAVDQDERVVHMNAAAGIILGISPESIVGKKIWESITIHKVCEIVDKTLRDATEVAEELQLIGPPQDRAVKVNASPLHDSQGSLVGAVVVLYDLSELHRLETVRRDFVANVSHELKTPITAIRGLVETLIDDKQMHPEHRERFLIKVRDQAMRLGVIVTDLLTISRLETQGDVLERKFLDLRDPVLASSQGLLPPREKEGIIIESQVPEEPVTVLGDEEALCQVVRNLLDNALKYTPKNGRVWVRLRQEEGHAVIEVEDTGIGIEPRDLDRIFERFYRVDKARSRELGGTGLGLSIVKHITHAHGGWVSVDSVPGKGSTFRIYLPLAPTSA